MPGSSPETTGGGRERERWRDGVGKLLVIFQQREMTGSYLSRNPPFSINPFLDITSALLLRYAQILLFNKNFKNNSG